MNRVTGIGGIFFKAHKPVELCAWYKKHLAMDVQDWGGASFSWADADAETVGAPAHGSTLWCVSAADGEQFAPSKSAFMINYRVQDLNALVQLLTVSGNYCARCGFVCVFN